MGKRVVKVIGITAVALSLATVVAAIALCAIFPNKYAAEVNAAAEEFGLDGALVRSVVWAESKFDKGAVSEKGAAGLMQLMPETFDACASALFIPQSARQIFDPQTSLRCGCYYLSMLIDKFDGDETAALMAYNAGEANARKFLRGEPIFPETQKYLKDITLAEKVYGIFM